MSGKAECLEQIAEIGIGPIGGKRQADILLDGAPRQQSRFLKYDPEAPRSRCAELTAEIQIKPGGDLQDRRLAATGRADQRTER